MKKLILATLIAIMAIATVLYAQGKNSSQQGDKVSIKLLNAKADIGKTVQLPNGDKKILFADREDYNDVLGPRRGIGLTRGWTSENGKFVGFADYGVYNKVYGSRFTLLNINREIVWQKDLEREVIQAGILDNGKIVVLFVGYFDMFGIKRVELRNANGEVIHTIPGETGGRGIVHFSKNNKYFSLFTNNNYYVFNEKGENIWLFNNIDLQNSVISNNGVYAALFSPGTQPSPSEGIRFITNGKVVKHQNISISPFLRAKGYLSSDDKYLALTDGDNVNLFQFKTGDLLFGKKLGQCIFAEWIGDKLLMVMDSTNQRAVKIVTMDGEIIGLAPVKLDLTKG